MTMLDVEAAGLDVAALTDVGTQRPHNEDACTAWLEAPDRAVLAVADGVSLAEAGEVASSLAIEVLLRAYREEPATAPAGQRLYRAVQQANIEIYDKAVAVPELRGMSTTLTAAVVDGDQLTVVHVGDSRLYLLRDGQLEALTKDHTVAAEKARYGLLSKEKLRDHPDKSVLTRSVGRELIVSRDRTGRPVRQGDVLLACSDGLHGVLDDQAMAGLLAGRSATEACRALVAAANQLGTPDNLSAVVLRVTGPVTLRPAPGLGSTLKRLAGFG
jgi:serine/threonine protein phosphatase PrpC